MQCSIDEDGAVVKPEIHAVDEPAVMERCGQEGKAMVMQRSGDDDEAKEMQGNNDDHKGAGMM